jgi:hypothetical protein
LLLGFIISLFYVELVTWSFKPYTRPLLNSSDITSYIRGVAMFLIVNYEQYFKRNL